MGQYFTLSIAVRGAAFDIMEHEIARILRTLAERIEADGEVPRGVRLRDVFGNDVGAALLIETEDE